MIDAMEVGSNGGWSLAWFLDFQKINDHPAWASLIVTPSHWTFFSSWIQVHKVFSSGLAAQEGTIQKGDEVLSINGKSLRGLPHAETTAALRQTRNLELAVVVVGKQAEAEGGKEGSGVDESAAAGKSHSVRP